MQAGERLPHNRSASVLRFWSSSKFLTAGHFSNCGKAEATTGTLAHLLLMRLGALLGAPQTPGLLWTLPAEWKGHQRRPKKRRAVDEQEETEGSSSTGRPESSAANHAISRVLGTCQHTHGAGSTGI